MIYCHQIIAKSCSRGREQNDSCARRPPITHAWRRLNADTQQLNVDGACLRLQEEAQEEFGWKLVHGDVFRSPRKGMLLSVFLGNGTQLFFMACITLGEPRQSSCRVLFGPRLAQTMIRSSVFHHKADYDTTKGVQKVVVQPWLMLFAVFACLGFLSPANRGALMTCSIVLWVCLGTPAGYVSARIYKSRFAQ